MIQPLLSTFRGKLRPHVLPAAILLIATFSVYARILDHDFLLNWDDDLYVTGNEVIKGFTLPHLRTVFSSFYVGNYAPLQMVSYMLDYSLWGLRAGGFLLTNLLLHAVNGLLFYALLVKINGRRLVAFTAAFIFLLHPVQVESVAWVAQRKTLLSMAFFLIAFLLYRAYRDDSRPRQYGLSLAAFSCALLAKSVAVILPPALVLYDLCFAPAGSWKKRLADKLPFIAAAGAVAFVALVSQAPEAGGGRRDNLYGNGPQATLFTMLPIFWRYVGMIFLPTRLSAVYDPPIRTGIDGTVLLSGLFFALVLLGLGFLYRHRNPLFFWGVLFFLGLLPVAQIVPLVTLMNDRYLYFPLLGAAPLLATALVALAEKLRLRQAGVVAGIGLILLPLPLMATARTGVWHDSVTLWSDVAAKAPTSLIACLGLGDAYASLNRPQQAIETFDRALRMDPRSKDALHRIAEEYMELHEYEKARGYLLELTRSYPGYSAGFLTLGDLYLSTGDFPGAEAAYRNALTLNPGSSYAINYLGIVYAKTNNFAAARACYQRALQSGEVNPTLRSLLGIP